MADPIKIKPYVRVTSKEGLIYRGLLETQLLDEISKIATGKYDKKDIASLTKSTKVYSKGTSRVTTKELLEFYSEVISRVDMGNKDHYDQQDKNNIELLLEIIKGLVLAIKAYEAIIRHNAGKAKND